MHYTISCKDPNQHFLRIELHIEEVRANEFDLQMPAWRPGRYQMAHFARNVMRMEAFDEEGGSLELFKTEKDRWRVKSEGSTAVTVRYIYYAHEMNAGSTYVDEEQLYLNPVSSLVYLPDRAEEMHRIELELPKNYKIATGLSKESERTLAARDLQELMDGSLIASAGMKWHSFDQDGVRFHLVFQGECRPDFGILERDFRGFIAEQIAAFGTFPVDEYHFLFQVLPYQTRHGVEHCNSTVIVLGPSYELQEEKGYEDLVAISSHELYHTWNVKRIRPSAMMPYDFTRENYTRLGYVAEGVTTYMGDQMLLRSGFYSTERYLEKLGALVQRHYDDPGRHNLSVADSSFDTWLDGYDRDVPGRKVSIYNEGALIAFMLDVLIRKDTHDERSLDDVIRRLYEEYALKGEGFEEEDLIELVEEVSGASFQNFFRDHVDGAVDYSRKLRLCLQHLGIEWEAFPKERFHEAWLGFRTKREKGSPSISLILPGSPAQKAGLELGDRILGVNGYEVNAENLAAWTAYFGGARMTMTLVRDGRILEREVQPADEALFQEHRLQIPSSTDDDPMGSLRAWKSSKSPRIAL